ncbi:nucleotide exchange factor GrpE [Buchnera aphidicola]|uniref:nucleotide exchange factor GrpE n=1 Tax=Buchnera aphidicola TaxID=9 RepID=UPI0034649A6E
MTNEKEKNEEINISKIENNTGNNSDGHLIKDNFISSLEIELKKIQEKVMILEIENNNEIKKLHNRLNSEIEKSRKFCLEKILIEFLPIIDNVERALTIIKEKKENIYLDILNKIVFISSLFNEILSEFNISKIKKKNVLFNPEIHQAMSVLQTNDHKPNQVIDIMQSGYILNECRLLRPAMVVVSKNKDN